MIPIYVALAILGAALLLAIIFIASTRSRLFDLQAKVMWHEDRIANQGETALKQAERSRDIVIQLRGLGASTGYRWIPQQELEGKWVKIGGDPVPEGRNDGS